jgi:hypothetical protein
VLQVSKKEEEIRAKTVTQFGGAFEDGVPEG